MRVNESYVDREAVPDVWSADWKGATTKQPTSLLLTVVDGAGVHWRWMSVSATPFLLPLSVSTNALSSSLSANSLSRILNSITSLSYTIVSSARSTPPSAPLTSFTRLAGGNNICRARLSNKSSRSRLLFIITLPHETQVYALWTHFNKLPARRVSSGRSSIVKD